MQFPIRFPNEADKIYEEAKEFRRLSNDERFRRIVELAAAGYILMRESPHQKAAALLQNAYEEQWQQAQRELFARHGL